MFKKSLPFFSLGLLFFALMINSCDKKVGKDPLLVKTPPANTTSTVTVVSECDTITYTKHIKLIVDTYCGSNPQCHTSGIASGNIELDTYDLTKIIANNGKLKQTVFNSVPKQMPPDGYDQLNDAQKKLINCWINNGAKN